jgi:hypothetical protein
MGRTAEFAAGSWIVRQPPRQHCQLALILFSTHQMIGISLQLVNRETELPLLNFILRFNFLAKQIDQL